MKANHTATPWKISSHPGPEILIDRDVPFDFTKVLRDHVGSLKISKEDAEFIIQAVNAHDELVAALKELMPLLHGEGNCLEFYEDEILKAEAALAKAERKEE